MGLIARINSFVNSFVQIGGPSGPGFNANSGALEAKNAANNAFAIVRGANPSGDNDLTTKKYVDEIAKPYIVTAQANAVTALIANSGVEHYIVVSAPGTGAAAAYTSGTILWDDGSGTGNVDILGPTDGLIIITTVALTGGTFTFNSNTQYVWTGSTWQSLQASVAGAVYCINFILGTSVSQSSVTSIPANAIVLRCDLNVTTPYSAGTTIAIGQTGTTSLLQATTDNVPTVADTYEAEQVTAWGSSALAVLATIGGSPSAGVATVTVLYSSPLS
jgi:hypothetical protein